MIGIHPEKDEIRRIYGEPPYNNPLLRETGELWDDADALLRDFGASRWIPPQVRDLFMHKCFLAAGWEGCDVPDRAHRIYSVAEQITADYWHGIHTDYERALGRALAERQAHVQWFHGDHAGVFKLGDRILPPQLTGKDPRREGLLNPDRNLFAFFTREIDIAKEHARAKFGGWVYRVEPEGEILPDTLALRPLQLMFTQPGLTLRHRHVKGATFLSDMNRLINNYCAPSAIVTQVRGPADNSWYECP
ncbi:MAG: hypothetical protein AAGA87_00035 [Pseudomonadota bacterium]